VDAGVALGADGDLVKPNDLARVVDAGRNGAEGGQGIVEGRVMTRDFDEAMVAARVLVTPDDLTQVVDTLRAGAESGRWVVEREVRTAAVEEAVG
jgi:hypothetical protein